MERTRFNTPGNNFSEFLCLSLFSSYGKILLNKDLLKYFGPDVTIYLTCLLNKYGSLKDEGDMESNWFFYKNKHILNATGLTLFQIQSCKKIMKSSGILKTHMKDSPPKEYYEIDFQKLYNLTCNFYQLHPQLPESPVKSNVWETQTQEANENAYLLGENDAQSLGNPNITRGRTFKEKNKKIKKEKNPFINYFPIKHKVSFEFIKVANQYYEWRLSKKYKVSDQALKIAANKIKDLTIQEGIDAMELAMDKNWKSLFPKTKPASTIKNQTTYEIIQDQFQDEIYQNHFYEYYLEAKGLMSNTDEGECRKLIWAMLKLFRWLKANQKVESTNVIPNPWQIIDEYLMWLNKETWIHDKSFKLFEMENVIFKKYFAESCNRIGVHILTGEYYGR